MNLIISALVNIASIMISANFVPGIHVKNLWAAFILSIALGILNVLVKPILIILTLPVNILTLGLFTLVINALIIMLAGTIVSGFSVDSFWSALLFGILLSLVNYILSAVFK